MGRSDFQAKADALVRAHRFELAVVVPLVGAALLVASATGRLPGWLAFHPLLVVAGVAAMRLPLLVALGPLLDRRAVAGLAGLAAFAYAVEWVGLRTGWPYGEFAYGVAIGPTAAGVPVALPLLYLPLVVNAVLLASLLLGSARRWRRRGLALGLVLAIDLVLDPGAVALGFWSYAAGGPYYGVPASNYAGWLLSGAVAVWGVDVAFDRSRLADRLAACEFSLDDLVSFGLLWGAVNLAFGQAAPVAVATGLLLVLGASGRVAFPSPRRSGAGRILGRLRGARDRRVADRP